MWEYKVETVVYADELEHILNSLGLDDWELVSTRPNDENVTHIDLILKRSVSG